MKPVIIKITGYAQSGKDTTSNYLVKYLTNKGHTAIRIGLADRLKVICQHLIRVFYGIDIPLDDFFDLEKKELAHPEYPKFNGEVFKLRTIMQYVGSEIIRENLWGEIWCDYVYKKLISSGQYEYIIISDYRFPDEDKYFVNLKNNGSIEKEFGYRVMRTHHIGIADDNKKHQSEKHILTLRVDDEIINDGSLSDLYDKIDKKILSKVL